MEVGESQPTLGKRVNVRCRSLASITTQVAVAEIIHQDYDDVGFLSLAALRDRERRQTCMCQQAAGSRQRSPQHRSPVKVMSHLGSPRRAALLRNSRKTDSLRAAKSVEFLFLLAPRSAAFALLISSRIT